MASGGFEGRGWATAVADRMGCSQDTINADVVVDPGVPFLLIAEGDHNGLGLIGSRADSGVACES